MRAGRNAASVRRGRSFLAEVGSLGPLGIWGGSGQHTTEPRNGASEERSKQASTHADATLNVAVWQGAAPPPLDPMGFRTTVGAVEGGGRLQNLRPGPARWLSAETLARHSDLPRPAGLAPPGRATRTGQLGGPSRCRMALGRPKRTRGRPRSARPSGIGRDPGADPRPGPPGPGPGCRASLAHPRSDAGDPSPERGSDPAAPLARERQTTSDTWRRRRGSRRFCARSAFRPAPESCSRRPGGHCSRRCPEKRFAGVRRAGLSRGPGRVSSAAFRRRRTRSPTSWPPGCSASPRKGREAEVAGGSHAVPALNALPGTDHAGRPPLVARGMSFGGPGASPGQRLT